MTQDEVIEMARQAGVWTEKDDWFKYTEFEDNWKPKLEAFAKLVAEKEREACAKVCETLWDTPANGMATEDSAYGNECATAIRARKQK